jgi:uncharacterized protein YjbI with pentapeptide repeats
MEPFEPPKYIEKLITAINDGAKSAQLGALAFTAIGLFLLATAFSATDEDLLLNRALTISQLGGTAVPVVFAFGLAPAVFVAAHFYTLIRYDMLTGNLRRFRADLALMVRSEEDRDRCRQLLANVEFVNALVMPEGSRASSWMFRWTVNALLAAFPVLVLLLVQMQSLRLQSYVVNWTHHACIIADLVLLIWFFGRLRGNDALHFWRAPIRRKVALCWMPAMVLLVDLAWLQVPGPASTTVRKSRADYWDQHPKAPASLIQWVEWLGAFNPVDLLLCTPGAWGCRFLTVTHRIIVARILDPTTFAALRAGADADEKHRASFEATSLRERTLRFANLAESELFAADLTGADLRHAALDGASLNHGILAGAQLQGASLFGAQLQGADLIEAQLQGAKLFLVQLQGANLSGAQLQGANLINAQLQGANLYEAQLQGANLASAQLQGADLSLAQLQGAYLRGAQLQGAHLSVTQLQGVDLRKAGLWNIDANEGIRLGLADLRDARFNDISVEDLLTKLPDGTPEVVKQLLRKRLVARDGAQTLPHPVDTTDGKILVTDLEDRAWSGLDRARQLTTQPADIDPALAEFLADTVAPISPDVAENVAERLTGFIVAERLTGLTFLKPDEQRPLIKLLGCRLQAQVDAKHVTLRADTIERLRAATGPCETSP